MTTWEQASEALIDRLDQSLLRDPEYLLARPGYGAPLRDTDICVMRLIGRDEQYDGDLIRSEFLPEWRVPIRPRPRPQMWLPAASLKPSDLFTLTTGTYLPLNAFAVMELAPEVVFPPHWVTPGRRHIYSVGLVRYVRTA